ncbi:MAG TPA: J domain-containing protein [Gammaproteobacteria bacterium]|nr:J domain-containing protein [Gammaproteobacteria bacterium]
MRHGSRPDFIRCYKILGLKPGCNWEQARRHYKLLSQRCHPDRFQHDAGAKADAEKRQRALNLAMRTLADYYRKQGCMPLRMRPKLRYPGVPEPEEWGARFRGQREHDPVGGGSGLWMLLLMAVPVASVIWLLVSGSGSGSLGARQESTLPGGVSINSGAVNVRSRPELFGFGDLPEVVRMVQGEPAYVEGNEWHYGKSVVYFRNGRVAGWLNHADSPLNATSGSPPIERGYIEIGSSPAEVFHIQGEPLFKSATRWDYGPSYIEFRDDKVSGWYSSPLRPLRVKE